MKTRIKIVETFDGRVTYYPQYKGWFFWHDFNSVAGYDYYVPWSFMDLQSAQAFIDSKIGQQTKPPRYVKYP